MTVDQIALHTLLRTILGSLSKTGGVVGVEKIRSSVNSDISLWVFEEMLMQLESMGLVARSSDEAFQITHAGLVLLRSLTAPF